MKKRLFAFAALVCGAAFLSTIVTAQARVRAGMLKCDVAPGMSFVVGSQKTLNCVFTSARRGLRERYTGRITRIGLDLGYTTGGKLVWAVYAPSRRGPGALAGTYVGGSAEATVGGGVGANVLVGGSNRSIALQPVSVGAQEGLDLALAIGGLELQPAR